MMFGGHASGNPPEKPQPPYPGPTLEEVEAAQRDPADIADASNATATLASKMCIVIAFDIPTDSVEDSYAKSRSILQEVKGTLGAQPNVQIWGAINEVAGAIIHVLNEGVEEQESGD